MSILTREYKHLDLGRLSALQLEGVNNFEKWVRNALFEDDDEGLKRCSDKDMFTTVRPLLAQLGLETEVRDPLII